MTDDIDQNEEMTLAAEYALGLLSPAEAEAFEAVLAVDPDLRDHYAAWAESFVSLTDDVAPVPPPAALEARIQAAIFGAPVAKKGLFARLGFMGPALAGVAAAIVVLVALNQTGYLRDDSPLLTAELTAADESLVVLASFDPDAQTLVLNRTVGAPREGRALEMWLVAGDAAPVSLGVWPEGQNPATLTVPADLGALMDGAILAVSDEPVGGSTTGAPTGDVLATGAVQISV